MKKYIFSTLLYISLVGCKCGGTSTIYEYVENLSGGDVVMKFYRDGQPYINSAVNADNVIIPNKSSKLIVQTGGRGVWSYWPSPFIPSDSLVVIFSNQKKSVHYGYNTLGKNPNAILYNNPRNLYNEASHVKKILIEKQCYLETEYRYTLTEQDFLNAK